MGETSAITGYVSSAVEVIGKAFDLLTTNDIAGVLIGVVLVGAGISIFGRMLGTVR